MCISKKSRQGFDHTTAVPNLTFFTVPSRPLLTSHQTRTAWTYVSQTVWGPPRLEHCRMNITRLVARRNGLSETLENLSIKKWKLASSSHLLYRTFGRKQLNLFSDFCFKRSIWHFNLTTTWRRERETEYIPFCFLKWGSSFAIQDKEIILGIPMELLYSCSPLKPCTGWQILKIKQFKRPPSLWGIPSIIQWVPKQRESDSLTAF